MAKNTLSEEEITDLIFIAKMTNLANNMQNDITEAVAKKSLDELKVACDEHFNWSHYFEVPLVLNVIIMFDIFNKLPELGKFVVGDGVEIAGLEDWQEQIANDPAGFSKAFIELKAKETNSSENNVSDYIYSSADQLEIIHAMSSQMRSLLKYGKSLSEIVESFKRGKELSFFKALRVDPTALLCPSLSRRFIFAHMQNDRMFLNKTFNAIRVTWEKPKEDLNALRAILDACKKANILEGISEKEAAKLFIETLRAYPQTEEHRSLMRFIQRWKNQI